MYGRYREDLGQFAASEARKNSLQIKRDSIIPYETQEYKKRGTAWKLKRSVTGTINYTKVLIKAS